MTTAAPNEPPVLAACRRLSRAMDLFEDGCCRHLGIHRSDLRALNVLEDGPVTMSALARSLSLTPGAVTPLVDRLESTGWVQRRRSETDRRSTSVALRSSAWEALAALYAPLGRTVVTSFAELPAHEREIAAAGMYRAALVFEGLSPPPHPPVEHR